MVRYVRFWQDGTMDGYSICRWSELQAFSNGVNVALNKPVSSSTGLDYNVGYLVTDGDLTSVGPQRYNFDIGFILAR